MSVYTIEQIKEQAGAGPVRAKLLAQLAQISERQTRTFKPFLRVTFVDSTGSLEFSVWENSGLFGQWRDNRLQPGDLLGLDAQWEHSDYGLEPKNLSAGPMTAEEQQLFALGSPERAAFLQECWERIKARVEAMQDPLLRRVCQLFLDVYGSQFRTAAGARGNHHERPGGLMEHTNSMQRMAGAVCANYPQLNKDLLLAGVLFHDAGKIVENGYGNGGLIMPYSVEAELAGHIPIGCEMLALLWNAPSIGEISTPERRRQVYFHLRHLILSHHGILEWGSPVEPKTAEAAALHHIDNLDAKMEMFVEGYRSAAVLEREELGTVYDRARPLGMLVSGLPVWSDDQKSE